MRELDDIEDTLDAIYLIEGVLRYAESVKQWQHLRRIQKTLTSKLYCIDSENEFFSIS